MNTPTNSELREAVKDGLANHTGEFANPWIFKGSYSHELLTDILNDIMASERLFKNLEALINKQIIEARKDEVNGFMKLHTAMQPDSSGSYLWLKSRLTQLRTTK